MGKRHCTSEHPFGNASGNPLEEATESPQRFSEAAISGVQHFAPYLGDILSADAVRELMKCECDRSKPMYITHSLALRMIDSSHPLSRGRKNVRTPEARWASRARGP